MTLSLNYQKISPLITPDTLLLTPNSRTQKAVYTGYISSIAANQVVESINLFSFSQWQNELWLALSFKQALPQRISALMVKTWLEQQIRLEPSWLLTNPAGVASQLLTAYQNLVAWDLELSDINRYGLKVTETTEIEYFKLWVKQLNHFCEDKNLIADFKILKYLRSSLNQLSNQLPKHILRVGFNQLTPLQISFFEHLERHQVVIDEINFTEPVEQACQIQFNDLQQELEFSARYAFLCTNPKQFTSQKTTIEPNKINSIGIVVENLAENLTLVHQSFSKVFHPLELKPWVTLSKPAYNVSAGVSLAEQAIVKIAQLILNLNPGQLSREEISLLKNTPFISWGNQKTATRHFLHQLYIKPRRNYAITSIIKSIELGSESQAQQLSLLVARLKQLADIKQKKLPVSEHITQLQQRLVHWGWADEECGENEKELFKQELNGETNTSSKEKMIKQRNYLELNEFEIQAKQLFFNNLQKCSSLADVYQKVSLSKFLNFFEASIKQQNFQVASDYSKVHILGMLEADGLIFDRLLIVGFNRKNWPQSHKINPFLPLALQREHDMPASSSEREYAYAKNLSHSLLHSAKQIIVTSSDITNNHSSNTEQHAEAVTSVPPFFSHLAVSAAEDFVRQVAVAEAAPDYQWIDDSKVELAISSIKGGTYLLSEYAKCPFKGMASCLFNINQYQAVEIGIDAREKGTWLHEAMELIWQELNCLSQLLDSSSNDLKTIISKALTDTKERNKKKLFATTNEPIIQLEFNKLSDLIAEWLSVEKTRADFHIHSLEEKIQLTLGELKLNFRIDRIDQNHKKELEIIDYKTGKSECKNWFSVRPTEAQMPAYMLALKDKKIAELSYARIVTGEVAQVGIVFSTGKNGEPANKDSSTKGQIYSIERKAEETSIKKIKNLSANTLDEQLKQWTKTLNRIAYGIVKGYFPVSPKDKKQSCLYCEYQSFCRIDEAQPNEQ